MRIERSNVLRVEPGERSPERFGDANGFKPKRLSSRAGLLDLQIPQVRSMLGRTPLEFYLQSLERGIRSERALKLAIAEMVLRSVSTRKVVAITEQLCDLDITSSQVSRAAAEFDEQLEAWRSRELGETPYVEDDREIPEAGGLDRTERAIPDGLTVFDLPEHHRRRLRTTNGR